MASRQLKSTYQQAEEPRGGMPLFGNADSSFDIFKDGNELYAIIDPYTYPTFCKLGYVNGKLRVVSVEQREYPVEVWADQTMREQQVARVRNMRKVDYDEPILRKAVHALNVWVTLEKDSSRN